MATSKKEALEFEVIADQLRRNCSRLAGKVEPCGDWPRLLFAANADGWNLELLDEYLTGDPENDSNLLRNGLIPQLVRRVNGQVAGLVLPGWFVDPRDDPDWRHTSSVVQHPLRRECINLLLVDGTRAAAWVAEVERRPRKSPKLGKWIGPGETGGALVDALKRGVATKA